MEEMQQLSVGEPEFFDLKQPWLYAPAEGARPAWGWHLLLGWGGGRRTPNFADGGQ